MIMLFFKQSNDSEAVSNGSHSEEHRTHSDLHLAGAAGGRIRRAHRSRAGTK